MTTRTPEQPSKGNPWDWLVDRFRATAPKNKEGKDLVGGTDGTSLRPGASELNPSSPTVPSLETGKSGGSTRPPAVPNKTV